MVPKTLLLTFAICINDELYCTDASEGSKILVKYDTTMMFIKNEIKLYWRHFQYHWAFSTFNSRRQSFQPLKLFKIDIALLKSDFCQTL